MSYKYSEIPSPKAKKEEVADFWEIEAIQNPDLFISQININKALSIGDDEIDNDGIESPEDEIDNKLEIAFQEITSRPNFTNNKYPFVLKKYSIKLKEEESTLKKIYQYLLLCTRFNMTEQKVQNGIDGTLLFEELCAYVATKYFGSKSESFVFGTAVGGGFEDKVKDLINKTGEGTGFKNPNSNPPTAKDFSIDVVSFINFADRRIGKLIAFGQCKTGTSWKNEIKRLKPEDFCKMWLIDHPVSTPLPLVFLTDTMHEDSNFYETQLGYIVFNRFRIIEYIEDDIPDVIVEKIKTWLEGAFKVLEIN